MTFRWQPLQCMETFNTHVCKMHKIDDCTGRSKTSQKKGVKRGGWWVCVYIYKYFCTWYLRRGRACSCSVAGAVAAAIVDGEGEWGEGKREGKRW